MATTSPAKFIREVRQEWSKVTLPTRKETSTSVLMVAVMVVVMAIFFFVADWSFTQFIEFFLGLGGAK